jgi:hypothetical protein
MISFLLVDVEYTIQLPFDALYAHSFNEIKMQDRFILINDKPNRFHSFGCF